MVSEKNKQKLRSIARRTGEMAKRAGSAYLDMSEAAARRIRKRLEESRAEAEGIARNPEPNDAEDAELLRVIERNHREAMAALRRIERSIDEIAEPMDQGSGFGFAPAETPGETNEEFDFTAWL